MVEVVGIKNRKPSREKERVLSELQPELLNRSLSFSILFLFYLWNRLLPFPYLYLYTNLSHYRCYNDSDHYNPTLQPDSTFQQVNLPHEFSGNPISLCHNFIRI